MTFNPFGPGFDNRQLFNGNPAILPPPMQILFDGRAVAERLREPLPLTAHEFVDGVIVVKGRFVRQRLTEVDPSWSTTVPTLIGVGETVALAFGLTVAGATRYAVGSGLFVRQSNSSLTQNVNQWRDLPPDELAIQEALAYAEAFDDALVKGAQLFGVGDYLADVPGDVATLDQLALCLSRWEQEKIAARAELFADVFPPYPHAPAVEHDDPDLPPWTDADLFVRVRDDFPDRAEFDKWLHGLQSPANAITVDVHYFLTLAEALALAQAHIASMTGKGKSEPAPEPTREQSLFEALAQPTPPPTSADDWNDDDLYRKVGPLFSARPHFDNWVAEVRKAQEKDNGGVIAWTFNEWVLAAQQHEDERVAEHWLTVFNRVQSMFPGDTEGLRKEAFWAQITIWLNVRPQKINDRMSVTKSVERIQQLMMPESRNEH